MTGVRDKLYWFLSSLWRPSADAKCYAVVAINRHGSMEFDHYCFDEYGDYEELLKKVLDDVESRWLELNKSGYDVYFQVLPLKRRPERGRGTAEDVAMGQWLWCDLDYKQVVLDYKQVVEEAEFKGCKELGDHALECYYKDGERWVRVSRPPLGEVLRQVEEKLGVKPAIVVDSGAGYHLYFKLSYEVDPRRLSGLEERIVDLLGGDKQSKDLARILRLPGTVNHKVARTADVIYDEPQEVDPEELERRLAEKKRARKPKLPEVLGELGDLEIARIKELLKEAYKPGQRQNLVLYLSGWAAKAGVHPVSVVKIVKALHEETGDADPLKERLSAVVYSYKKAGIDVDRYADAIEAIAGIRPYGLEREIRGKEVKGVSGLRELLEAALGEERARGIIEELERVFNSLQVEPIYCLSGVRIGRKEVCDTWLEVRRIGDVIELRRTKKTARRKKGTRGPGRRFNVIAVLPAEMKIIKDKFYGEEFYTAWRDGKPIAVAYDIDGFIEELKNRQFAVSNATKEVLIAIEKLMEKVEGYIAPGIADEGIVDPRGELDLADYGIEGLIAVHRWIKAAYPAENVPRALANVAFLLAKIVSPIVRKHNGVFVDHVVWNYGRGGEGKTTLTKYVLVQLLGFPDENRARRAHVLISGAITSGPQMRNLISFNRLPLILDEQTENRLINNADVILAIAVGLNTIGVHAARYGLGIGAEFLNLRGLMINTNVPFAKFLKKAKDLASDVAFARRTLVIAWEHKPINFIEPPNIKPILGAVDKVYRKYKDELLEAKDLPDLAKRVMHALAKEYGFADVLEDYVLAVDLVVKEAEEERRALVRDDAEELVDAAYAFARQELGIQAKSAWDVIKAVLENPAQSGVDLVKGDYEESEEVRKRLSDLLGESVERANLNELREKFGQAIAEAVAYDKYFVRIWAGALGGKIRKHREFMGGKLLYHPQRGTHYYRIPLDKFIEAFLTRGG